MNAEELYEEWTKGESTGMRPQRVQAVRDDIEEITGLTVPRRISEIEGWLDAMYGSGVLTRKLRAAAEAPDEEESDAEDESAED